MPASMLERLSDLVTSAAVAQASAALGEPPDAVSRGTRAAFTAVLNGLALGARQPKVLRDIFRLSTARSNDVTLLSNVGDVLAGGALTSQTTALGQKTLAVLFGSHIDMVAQSIAGYAGVTQGSANTLLTAAVPLVLAQVGERLRAERQPSAGALAAILLREQTRSVGGGETADVSPLRPAGTFRDAGAATASWFPRRDSGSDRPRTPSTERTAAAAPSAIPIATERGGASAREAKVSSRTQADHRRGWLWLPIILGVGAAVVLVNWPALERWWAGPDFVSTASRAPSFSRSPKLSLNVPYDSVESRAIRSIEDIRPLGTADWFELDRITFQTGSNSLTAASAEQVRNIAAILAAYPAVRLKIGGYTDNIGDPAANLRLSDARANTVMRELIDLGIAPERLTAEGYGEQQPVADNATPEGRARNRRIAFRITQR